MINQEKNRSLKPNSFDPKILGLLIFSVIGMAIVESTFPQVYRLVVDEVLGKKSLEQMPKFVFTYVGLVILLISFATLLSFARSTLAMGAMKSIRNQLVLKLKIHTDTDINQQLNPETLQLAMNDATEYRIYWRMIQDASFGFLKAVIGFAILLTQSISLTIFVLIYTILALWIPWWLNKSVEKSSKAYYGAWGQVTEKLENLIMGVGQFVQITVFNRQSKIYEEKFNTAIQKAQRLSVQTTLASYSFVFFNFLLTPLGFVFLLPQIQDGTVSTGLAIALSMYASHFINDINTVIDAWSQHSQLSGAFDRIKTFLAREPEQPPLPALQLEPKQGLTVLTGATGVGKTTLMSALFNHGERKNVRYLHQRLEFPDWTLQEILDLPQVKAEVSQELLGLLKVTDLTLPLAKLSGGERQLVALALIVADSPRLVYLDESFSAMNDALAEKAVGIIKKYRQKLKTVVVAHQPLVQSLADNVVILQRDSNDRVTILEAT